MTTARLAAILAIVLGSTVAVADSPESALNQDEARFKAAMLRYSNAVAELLQEEIEDNKARHARGMLSDQAYSQQVKWLRTKLKLFREQPYQVPKFYIWNLHVGDIGRLTGNIPATTDPEPNRYRVLQVIDGQNMLIEGDDGITSNEANVGIRRVQKIAWVAGVDTAGVVDDSFVKLGQIFEVKGTKQYATALGSNTVFMISPFAIQHASAFVDKLSALDNPPARKDAPAQPKWKTEFRTWKDASGNFSIRAKYSGIIAGNVLLVTDDGRKIKVPIEKLSDADRQLLE